MLASNGKKKKENKNQTTKTTTLSPKQTKQYFYFSPVVPKLSPKSLSLFTKGPAGESVTGAQTAPFPVADQETFAYSVLKLL